MTEFDVKFKELFTDIRSEDKTSMRGQRSSGRVNSVLNPEGTPVSDYGDYYVKGSPDDTKKKRIQCENVDLQSINNIAENGLPLEGDASAATYADLESLQAFCGQNSKNYQKIIDTIDSLLEEIPENSDKYNNLVNLKDLLQKGEEARINERYTIGNHSESGSAHIDNNQRQTASAGAFNLQTYLDEINNAEDKAKVIAELFDRYQKGEISDAQMAELMAKYTDQFRMNNGKGNIKQDDSNKDAFEAIKRGTESLGDKKAKKLFEEYLKQPNSSKGYWVVWYEYYWVETWVTRWHTKISKDAVKNNKKHFPGKLEIGEWTPQTSEATRKAFSKHADECSIKLPQMRGQKAD